MGQYFQATRHPWSSFLFLVPLVAVYEGGVVWLGGDRADRLRNGADTWFRWQLETFGAGHAYAAPALVLGLLLLWSWWRWFDRPADPVTTWFGMAFEGAAFAAALWQFGQNYGPIIDKLGVKLDIPVAPDRAARVLTYLGAGIYEEALFRLGLFGGLLLVLRLVLLPRLIALPLAATAAAAVFAAAHHIGPHGEAMNAYVFLFRAAAGLIFTALYVWRGFGVAVAAHAGYDILVGVT
jgi:hypothetical protein